MHAGPVKPGDDGTLHVVFLVILGLFSRFLAQAKSFPRLDNVPEINTTDMIESDYILKALGQRRQGRFQASYLAEVQAHCPSL